MSTNPTPNRPTELPPPPPPSAPGGAALPLPTAEPVDPRPVRVALALAYPDKPCRPTSTEMAAFSERASYQRPGYASWHRPLEQWQAEWFGVDAQAA